MTRALLAGLFLATVAAATPGEVKQIAPGVFVRMEDQAKHAIANSGWVVFRDYVLVIDANYPWGARAMLNDIRKTTDKPVRYVFDTHYHSDHAFGNSVFVDAGATVVSSKETALESAEKNPAAWKESQGSGEYDLKAYRLEQPQIRFRDILVFDDGTHRVELRRVGPAHTRGDSVAYLPKERVLFTGDLVVSRPAHKLDDPDVNHDAWIRVLDDLARMDVAIVVPGHGELGTVETIRGDRAFLADMVTQIRAGIARGESIEQIQQKIDLSKHHPWGDDPVRARGYVRVMYPILAKPR
jgi:glyoxylase-like metal-dependent hydrolase (beta-lactamase superfamily II)